MSAVTVLQTCIYIAGKLPRNLRYSTKPVYIAKRPLPLLCRGLGVGQAGGRTRFFNLYTIMLSFTMTKERFFAL